MVKSHLWGFENVPDEMAQLAEHSTCNWRGRGTVDSAFVLYNIVNEYLEQGQKLYTFFINYSKAFDYIVHDNLWYKLLNLGVQRKIIDIIRSMYTAAQKFPFRQPMEIHQR